MENRERVEFGESAVPGLLASLGSLLEMQSLRRHPGPRESEPSSEHPPCVM